MVKKYTLFLLSLLCTISLLSQSNNAFHQNYKVNYFTIEEGLSNNKVNAICKDSFGFIWFGTNEGLNKYDGYTTTIYQTDKSDTLSISNNLIRTIVSGKDGRLWIGTDDGLNLYNPDINGFNRISIGNIEHDLNFVWQLFEDKYGVLWIATHHGLYYKEKDSTNVKAFKKINDMVENPHVISVYRDSRNNLWAGTREHGLLCFSFTSNKSKQFSNVHNDKTTISGNWISSIYEDKKGNLWVGTSDNGLNYFDYETSTFISISLDDNLIDDVSIRDIVEDKYGQLWIGTGTGLYLKNSETNDFMRFAHTNNDYTNLNHNSIYDIYIDDIDIVWLATYAGGVNYIDLNQKKFNNYTLKVNDNHFLNSSTVYTIYEDSNHNLWIGTVKGGINYYNRSTKTFDYILNDPQNSNSLSGNNVKAIIEDKSGNFWIGTYKNGLNYYNVKTKTFKHFRANNQTPQSLFNDNVYDLLLDSEDNLWIAMEVGLDLWPKGSDKIIHLGSKGNEKSIFEGDIVSTVFEDSYKNIWVGTYNHGLLLFNKSDSSFTIFKEDLINTIVYSISEDNKNHLWIGGSNGLYYLNLQKDSLINYTEKDGLPATQIFKTFDDKNGNIWMSTTAGLSKFINGVNTPHIPNFRNYDTDDGLQSKQFVYNSNDKSSSGEMYFGGINGFNSFFPEDIVDNPYKASVVITGLKIFNSDVAIGEKVEGRIVLKTLIHKIEELVLSYKHYVFTIQFAALHYAQPDKNQYAYRLEGFDPENSKWNYTGAENRNATYTNLSGGEYIFKVKASNNDGVWNENPTILKIKILPPFWKTWWFITLEIFVILLSAVSIYYLRVNALKKQKQVLEHLVNVKTADLSKANTLLQESQKSIEEQAEELLTQKEDLIKANVNLKALNSTKDKFFSIIAHDIKNPFQSVLGFSEILLLRFDSLTVEKRRNYIQAIYDSSVSIYKLLENLLQWSRAQTKNIQFSPTNFKLNDIINDNILLFQENIKNKEIKLIFDTKVDREVYADSDMINTVIRNILSNAIKFTEVGGEIFLSCLKEKKDLVISIRDTGIGIQQNDIQKLFKIDHNFVSEGTSGEKGTGLGLLICKEFIEKHSGKIWVESEFGKGSTFFFTIPNLK